MVAPAAPRGSTPRLSADDWVRAAFEIMVDDGVAGVRIPRLCERLGVTKGSFYWHFEDLDAFFGELAHRWSGEGADGRVVAGAGEDASADQVVLSAMGAFADRRSRNVARAMREWAQTDERARAAIRRSDELVFERLTAAIASVGFDQEEAEVRAKVLYYAGVGFAHVGPLGERRRADQLLATWEILTRR